MTFDNFFMIILFMQFSVGIIISAWALTILNKRDQN